MVTMADQKKGLVYASVLLLLVVGFIAPIYAGTLRYDFDDLPPHKISSLNQRLQIDDWERHRKCNGLSVGAWSISVEDGFVKVKDEGCGMGATTGIYRLDLWTDYEVKTRIQLRSLAVDVSLYVRAGPPIMNFPGNSYRIWRKNPVDIGEWYDVRIVAEGNRVTSFLDGQKVDEQVAARISGGVAFVAFMSEFWLDYVEITGDDIPVQPVQPVQPQGRLATCWAKLKRS